MLMSGLGLTCVMSWGEKVASFRFTSAQSTSMRG